MISHNCSWFLATEGKCLSTNKNGPSFPVPSLDGKCINFGLSLPVILSSLCPISADVFIFFGKKQNKIKSLHENSYAFFSAHFSYVQT